MHTEGIRLEDIKEQHNRDLSKLLEANYRSLCDIYVMVFKQTGRFYPEIINMQHNVYNRLYFIIYSFYSAQFKNAGDTLAVNSFIFQQFIVLAFRNAVI